MRLRTNNLELPDRPAPGDNPAGRMRVEKSVPREVYCPRCGGQMRPTSTPKSFRWFKCLACGQTHRLWRQFEWVAFRAPR